MKRFLFLISTTIVLQSCTLARLGYEYPGVLHENLSPTDYTHNSTYGYDTPVSPIHISNNIEKQPVWGPAGYDCAAFYYMPELNIYYDINSSLFYYLSGRSWIAAQYLPPSYRAYDLYRTYKVVLNYSSPWQYNNHHRSQFRHYRNDRSQLTIHMSRDPRYVQNWKNTRPWVDPNRNSNRKSDYKHYHRHK